MLRELPGNWEQVTDFWKEIGLPDAWREEQIEWYEAEPTLNKNDGLGRRNHLWIEFCGFTCDVQHPTYEDPTYDVQLISADTMIDVPLYSNPVPAYPGATLIIDLHRNASIKCRVSPIKKISSEIPCTRPPCMSVFTCKSRTRQRGATSLRRLDPIPVHGGNNMQSISYSCHIYVHKVVMF